MLKKHVGILGAAFDPPHYTHALIGYAALKTQLCDEICLIPSPDRYDKKTTLIADKRFMLATLLADEMQKRMFNFTVNNEELNFAHNFCGTYKFIQYLQNKYNDTKFSLIIGMDSYINLPKWINGEKLIQDYNLIFCTRNTYDNINKYKNSDIYLDLTLYVDDFIKKLNITHICSHDLLQLSSSQIKTKLLNKQSLNFNFNNIMSLCLEYYL